VILLALRWLGRNFSTLLLAFALALAVWVAVVINSDPNQECTSPRLIPIELIGEDPGLRMMDDIPEQARIRIFAPQSICEDLSEAESSLQAVVDLSGLGPGEHTVTVTPEIPSRFQPFRVLSFSPEEITVTLETMISRELDIRLRIIGEPALGFDAADPKMEVRQVTVSGPMSQVDQVDQVEATLNISGARQTVQSELSLQAVDQDGNPVDGVTITPNRVDVSVQVQQLGGYRDVAVKVRTTGQWAIGYRLTNISVSPPTVTVFSPDPQVVNDLPGFVETEPLDLTAASDDLEARVELDLPEGVTLVGGDQSVLVQVSIAAIESNLSMTLPVEVIGLSPGLQADVSPDAVDVILLGPVPVLETLTPDTVRVVVDLTDLEEGVHQVTPFVDILPDPVQEQGINPIAVEVTLSLLPTPTPTATPSGTPTAGP
jgi:YbbR domain-containing protein